MRRLLRLAVAVTLGVGAAPSSTLAGGGEVKVSVNLYPAGSFVATSGELEVRGFAKKEGSVVSAKDLVLKLDSLKTGIGLRDRHMREKYFDTAKHPTAVLTKAEGKDGTFQGELVIRQKAKAIQGTYEIAGGKLKARFRCALTDFGIPEANYMGVGVEDEVEVEVILPEGGKP